MPLQIPPLGTHEIFVELNDASGGSGANFVIKWDAAEPVSPPLVESLHANMDGGKAVIFMNMTFITVATIGYGEIIDMSRC